MIKIQTNVNKKVSSFLSLASHIKYLINYILINLLWTK